MDFNFAITRALVLLFIILCHGSRVVKSVDLEPDATMKAPEYIESRGFVCETHEVTTPDGYILTLHRVVNPFLNKSSSSPLKPVLFNHCLLCSSDDWLINAPGGNVYAEDPPADVLRTRFLARVDSIMETSQLPFTNLISHMGQSMWPLPKIGNNIAFELARYGYDVWLLNVRGNMYSLGHNHLNSSTDPDYWKFTLDEIVQYDTTASIDYILNKTTKEQLHYIGFSQGSNMILSLLSQSQEYAQKMDNLIAIAPAMILKHQKSPIRFLIRMAGPVLYPHAGAVMMGGNKVTTSLVDQICFKPFLRELCNQVTFMFVGYDRKHLNTTRIGVYTRHSPAGTSSWVLEHYSQTSRRKDFFHHFDYGTKDNIRRYGQKTPPMYDMTKVHHPKITFFHSQNDWLADMEDFYLLRKELGTKPIIEYKVPVNGYNHLDNVRAQDVSQWINPQLLAILLRSDLH